MLTSRSTRPLRDSKPLSIPAQGLPTVKEVTHSLVQYLNV